MCGKRPHQYHSQPSAWTDGNSNDQHRSGGSSALSNLGIVRSLNLKSRIAPLGAAAVALLVLLAAAAGARIVAAHLRTAHDRFAASGIIAAELKCRQFLFLLAFDVAREV